MSNILFSLSPEHQLVTPNCENIEEYCDEPIVPLSTKKSKNRKKNSKGNDTTILSRTYKSKKITKEESKKKYEDFMKAVKNNDSFKNQIESEEEKKMRENMFKLPDVSNVKLIYEVESKSVENVSSEIVNEGKSNDLHKKASDVILNVNETQKVQSIETLDKDNTNSVNLNDLSFPNLNYNNSLITDENMTDSNRKYSVKLDETSEESQGKLTSENESITLLDSTNLTYDTTGKLNQNLSEICELPNIKNKISVREPNIENYSSSDDEGSLQFVTIEKKDTIKDDKVSSKYRNQNDHNKKKNSLIYHGKPRRKVPVRCVIPIDGDFYDETNYFEASSHLETTSENEIYEEEDLKKNDKYLSIPIKRKSTDRKSFIGSSRNELIEMEKNDSMEMSRYFLDIVRENFAQPIMTIDNMLKIMAQEKLLSFRKLFPQKIKKIGEGSFGEVYSAKNLKNQNVIYKVTPFEPDNKTKTIVNGDILKGCRELLVEYIVTNEMSKLSEMSKFSCDNFVKLYKGIVVKGTYPKILLDAWKVYERNNEIFNEDPWKYKDKVSYYMILELEDAGIELEKFDDLNKFQAYSIIFQLIHCLRIAESVFLFEHRDLHESNILIQKVDENSNIVYKYNLNKYELKSFGVKVKIIDYTLSRMSLKNEEYYLNLNEVNGLFDCNSDSNTFQEIYLKMRKLTNGDWSMFCSKNNLLWIIYHVKRLFSFKDIEDHLFLDFFLKDVSEMTCLEELINNNKFIQFQKNFIIL